MRPPQPSRRTVLRVCGAGLVLAGGARAAGDAGTASAGSARSAGASTRSFGPVGEVEVAGLSEAVVADDGTTVYGAVDDGIAAVDVSEPSSPTVVAQRRDLLADREHGPVERLKDVAIDGDRLIAVAPDADFPETVKGVAVFDVSSPADPAMTRILDTDHGIHNAWLDGTTAYLTGSGTATESVVTVDVETGEELDRWSPIDEDEAWREVNRNLRQCHAVHVRDDRLFASYWDAGTWILDASDPSSLSPLGRVGGRDRETLADYGRGNAFQELAEMPGNFHNARLHPEGDLLAVGHEAGDHGDTDRVGGPAGIGLWDVSDPAAPERVAAVAPPEPPDDGGSTAHNFAWRGDRLYTSWYQGGARVFDVSDPATPRLLAAWRDPEDASFWTAVPTADGFVGASTSIGRPDEVESEAELFAFPEPDDEGEPAPAGVWPGRNGTATPSPTATATDTATGTGTAQDGGSGTGSGTRTESGPGTGSQTGTDGGTGDATGTATEGSDPGFGALAAVAAAVGGAVALARRRSQDR